jgi:hypothetical protein
MQIDSQIPQSVIDATPDEDPLFIEIQALEDTIAAKDKELRYLISDLDALKIKRRNSIKIPHRENAMWCLEIDKDNPWYFLKTSKGVATCVAIKNRLPIVDADLKSKTASALSWLYLNKEVGRTGYGDTRYYGVKEFFTKDEDGFYSIIKPKIEKKLSELKEVKLR